MSETVNKTIEDVIKEAKSHNRRIDTKLIMKAYNYAHSHHGDQCRRSGEPYIIHPLNVAYILADIGLDDSTICAALLHDVVEDTDATSDDIRREFSLEIEEMVEGCTNINERIGNTIGESGAEMISEALKCNSSLTELNLWRDEIEPIETKWIEMKQMSE